MGSGFATCLTTWSDLEQRLAASGDAVTAEPGRVEVRVTTAAGDVIPLELRAIDVGGATWITAAGIVGSLRHLSPLELLANNAHSTIGGFCTIDGQLAVRHKLPLVGLRVADLDDTLRELAELVAWSRRRVRELGAPLRAWTIPGGRAP